MFEEWNDVDSDAKCQRVYELEVELKELKSNFATLDEQCYVAESARDAKEWELADLASKVPLLETTIDEKDKDL